MFVSTLNDKMRKKVNKTSNFFNHLWIFMIHKKQTKKFLVC